jgi:hypothetical protein
MRSSSVSYPHKKGAFNYKGMTEPIVTPIMHVFVKDDGKFLFATPVKTLKCR